MCDDVVDLGELRVRARLSAAKHSRRSVGQRVTDGAHRADRILRNGTRRAPEIRIHEKRRRQLVQRSGDPSTASLSSKARSPRA